MSDPLTEAVRRLKALREDVERLKSARNEEGELRFLRQFDEQLGIADAVTARVNDRLVSEQLGVGDSVTTTVTNGATFVADSSTADGGDLAG